MSDQEDPRVYFQCLECDLLFLSPEQRLSPEQEKQRYLLHNNDIDDPRYQNFVRPLVEIINARHPLPARGLDFGSGTGPVLSHLLRHQGYQMSEYDPFFSKDIGLLQTRYDFIVSCEVAEHFFSPLQEFEKLKTCLKPNGTLALMTQLWQGEEVHSWYYAKDPTHVVFYSERNLSWLKNFFSFSDLQILDSRKVVFEL